MHFFVGGQRVATSKRDGLGVDPVDPPPVPAPAVDGVLFYRPDQVGTNTLITQQDGSVVLETHHDPFGAIDVLVDGAGQTIPPVWAASTYLYTGQEHDRETSLEYLGARYYDSWAGRFWSQDPELVGPFEGVTFARLEGDGQRGNPYAYVVNRPTVLTDPTGACDGCPNNVPSELTFFFGLPFTGGGPYQLAESSYIVPGEVPTAGADPSEGNQGFGQVPDAFEPFVDDAQRMGEALRDSPIRQGALDGTRRLLPQSVFSKLRERLFGGVTFDQPSPAAEARFLFGDMDRNVIALGIGVAADRVGGPSPDTAPRELFGDSAAISVQRGRGTPFVWVGPRGNIILLGQPTDAVSSRFCVTLSGAGGC